jgi:hypothetical protein
VKLHPTQACFRPDPSPGRNLPEPLILLILFPVPQVLRLQLALLRRATPSGSSHESHNWTCERHGPPWISGDHPNLRSACFGSTGRGNSSPKLRYRSGNRWCLAFAGLRSVDVVSRTQTCSPNPLYPRVQTRPDRDDGDISDQQHLGWTTCRADRALRSRPYTSDLS